MHVISGHIVHPHSPAFSHISLNFMSIPGLQFSPPGRLAAFSESVAQNKSTRSRKPKLSTMERGHYMVG